MAKPEITPAELKNVIVKVIYIALGCMVFYLVMSMGVMPFLRIYHQNMEGRAMLAKSEFSKQIIVQEAKALDDAAKFKADADITRAKGAAEAIRILGDSLKANPEYIRYKFVENLEIGDHDTIYLPTEAGMPILESQRLSTPKKPLTITPVEER